MWPFVAAARVYPLGIITRMPIRLRPLRALLVALALILLAACSATPFQPGQQRMIVREQSRWMPVEWATLPAWQSDRVREAWPALLRSCERPSPDWAAFCNEARRTDPRTDAEVRAWLEQRLRPYRVESLSGDSSLSLSSSSLSRVRGSDPSQRQTRTRSACILRTMSSCHCRSYIQRSG